jgi:hypothetical protein
MSRLKGADLKQSSIVPDCLPLPITWQKQCWVPTDDRLATSPSSVSRTRSKEDLEIEVEDLWMQSSNSEATSPHHYHWLRRSLKDSVPDVFTRLRIRNSELSQRETLVAMPAVRLINCLSSTPRPSLKILYALDRRKATAADSTFPLIIRC